MSDGITEARRGTYWKNEKYEVPTHDPQTGELNPYYKDLTGKENPYSSIVNPELYNKIKGKDIKFNTEIKKYMPNQKWHRYVSFLKSGVRIVGYALIPFNLGWAVTFLILSEGIGIIEELV